MMGGRVGVFCSATPIGSHQACGELAQELATERAATSPQGHDSLRPTLEFFRLFAPPGVSCGHGGHRFLPGLAVPTTLRQLDEAITEEDGRC
jgi:hypothetical protein